MPDPALRKSELTRYIEQSRSVQRALGWMFLAGLGLALALLIGGAGGTAFLAIAGVSAIVAGIGVWITHGHIADFQQQLKNLR